MSAPSRLPRRPYRRPSVKTLDTRALLEALGPAHCDYGPSPENPTGGGHGHGNGHGHGPGHGH